MNLGRFPSTRYRGSKRTILAFLHSVLQPYEFDDVLDLYSGSGIVSLMFRQMGKRVHANDFLLNCNASARALLHYDGDRAVASGLERNLRYLLEFDSCEKEKLICKNFHGIYFTDEENNQLDLFCQKKQIIAPKIRDLYVYLLSQACLKKRPYNIFDKADLSVRLGGAARASRNQVTWKAPFILHATKCLAELNAMDLASNREHTVTSHDACDLDLFERNTEMVYVDPPCIDEKGGCVDYAHSYHFLEGLCDYDLYSNADHSKANRSIISNPSNWSTLGGAKNAIGALSEHFDKGVIALSYRHASKLKSSEIESLMRRPGRDVLTTTHDNQNDYLVISRPS